MSSLLVQHTDKSSRCRLDICVLEVVDKENIRNLIVLDILHDILCEITEVHHEYFLERAEEITWQGIAVTVFDYHQSTPVLYGSLDVGSRHIAPP